MGVAGGCCSRRWWGSSGPLGSRVWLCGGVSWPFSLSAGFLGGRFRWVSPCWRSVGVAWSRRVCCSPLRPSGRLCLRFFRRSRLVAGPQRSLRLAGPFPRLSCGFRLSGASLCPWRLVCGSGRCRASSPLFRLSVLGVSRVRFWFCSGGVSRWRGAGRAVVAASGRLGAVGRLLALALARLRALVLRCRGGGRLPVLRRRGPVRLGVVRLGRLPGFRVPARRPLRSALVRRGARGPARPGVPRRAVPGRSALVGSRWLGPSGCPFPVRRRCRRSPSSSRAGPVAARAGWRAAGRVASRCAARRWR